MDENFNIGITMINDVRWNKVELCWLLKNFSRQIEILVQCPKPVLEPEIAMLKMKKIIKRRNDCETLKSWGNNLWTGRKSLEIFKLKKFFF